MTKTAPKPENMHVYLTLENNVDAITGLDAIGPLHNAVTEGTLVELIRKGRVDWGAFEQEFEDIPTLDRPQPLRSPTRDNATITIEVVGFDDSTDAELSAVHLLAAAADWSMGVTKDAAGAAEYNFLDDLAVSKATDLVGWALEAVQYDDAANVLWRRRIHNCKLAAKPSYGTGGKVVKVEITLSDARYIDQDTTDVGATHSDA